MRSPSQTLSLGVSVSFPCFPQITIYETRVWTNLSLIYGSHQFTGTWSAKRLNFFQREAIKSPLSWVSTDLYICI